MLVLFYYHGSRHEQEFVLGSDTAIFADITQEEATNLRSQLTENAATRRKDAETRSAEEPQSKKKKK